LPQQTAGGLRARQWCSLCSVRAIYGDRGGQRLMRRCEQDGRSDPKTPVTGAAPRSDENLGDRDVEVTIAAAARRRPSGGRVGRQAAGRRGCRSAPSATMATTVTSQSLLSTGRLKIAMEHCFQRPVRPIGGSARSRSGRAPRSRPRTPRRPVTAAAVGPGRDLGAATSGVTTAPPEPGEETGRRPRRVAPAARRGRNRPTAPGRRLTART